MDSNLDFHSHCTSMAPRQIKLFFFFFLLSINVGLERRNFRPEWLLLFPYHYSILETIGEYISTSWPIISKHMLMKQIARRPITAISTDVGIGKCVFSSESPTQTPLAIWANRWEKKKKKQTNPNLSRTKCKIWLCRLSLFIFIKFLDVCFWATKFDMHSNSRLEGNKLDSHFIVYK